MKRKYMLSILAIVTLFTVIFAFKSFSKTEYTKPATGAVTERYTKYHKGVDFADIKDNQVTSMANGKVINIYKDEKQGYVVTVLHSQNLKSEYSYLTEVSKNKGDTVEKGEIIGFVKYKIGKSTTPHLHFSVYENNIKVDPEVYIR